MKKILSIILLTVAYFSINAQSIKFTETSHEFYHIQEAGGPVSCQFLFTNMSTADITVKSVQTTSCPCLSFKWDSKKIAPNEKGIITVTVNPLNRKGMFAYPLSVTVIENNQEVNYDLMVKGYIVPIPKTKEEEYGMREGNLRYKTNQKKYVVHREQVVTDTFHFYNVWDSTMTFTTGNLPPSVKVLHLTESLQPKEEGIVVFSFDAKIKNDWGSVYERLFIVTNDPERAQKTFYIIAEIYDDFESWTDEQKANAPRIYTESDSYDFGTDTSGKSITHTFTIKNVGKSPLLVRKVKTSCGCTTLKQVKSEILPGESVPVEVIFNTRGKTGNRMQNVDLITNDPLQPKLSLFIKGNLIEIRK
ncbi:MAG TPA: DUF1573 domain-containing protein [Bacteroidales bacterium]|nr:DUF1573 domain-containing protein [Bacteroidales bacterium]HON21251.1 DUF1573 domain-containing protein [Bacteroidales bacterium]HOR81876.1 DUF1573 domain-containing protein [Bacteroidales bacterium]HPJ91673.1 DUF1573 domain-containing protein [Bacteroidales bacterium]HQB20022.1 DUF1573 domain-containing protein [Bacteroidales bacterium]